jgi:hypothetical protein
MGGPSMMRRQKEVKRAEQAKEKEGKKEQRKKDKANNQVVRKQGGEDPDLAGIVPGPQEPLI